MHVNSCKNPRPNCSLTGTQPCPTLSLITSWNCSKMQISNSMFRPHGFIWATSMWPFCIETHKNMWPLCHSPTPSQKSILKGFQQVRTILTRRDEVPDSRVPPPKFFLPSFFPFPSFLPSLIYLNRSMLLGFIVEVYSVFQLNNSEYWLYGKIFCIPDLSTSLLPYP